MKKIFTIHPIVITITCSILCSSCTTVGELPRISELKSKIENFKHPVQLPSQINVAQFADCMAPLSAKLKPGFLALIDKLNQQQFLFEQMAALDESMLLDNSHNMRDYLELLVTELTYDISIPSTVDSSDQPAGLGIKNKIESVVSQLQQKTKPSQEELKEISKRSAAYLKAYFKKGASQVAASAQLDETEKSSLQTRIASILNRKTDDPAISKVLDELTQQLQKSAKKVVNNSSGFISRDGIAYTFPGVANSDGQINIDHSQVEADVIRIILEALRDTYAPVPVLANSSAATFDKTNSLLFDVNGSTSTTVDWYMDHRYMSKSLPVTLTEDQFQNIEAKARSVESSVAGAIGKAIRGGSWGSLNNEAVARSIETAAGVLARHTTERAEWCAQAQGKNNN